MDENSIAISGALVLFAFIFYRRLRRLFTRQRYSTLRVLIPVALFGLLTLILFPMLSLTTGLAPAAGIALGSALGWYGSGLTALDVREGEIYFVPDRYIATIVLALFVWRLFYRMLIYEGFNDFSMNPSNGGISVPAEFASSPLTVMLLFVLFGYYVSYYGTLWNRVRVLRESTSQV